MSSPLFSIIVPVYNVKNYLETAIKSITGQDWPDWEAILVDDQSNDGSAQLAQELAQTDNRLHFYQHEHGGLSASRNFGMQQAQGDYFLFLDADDYFSPGLLGQLQQAIVSQPDLAVLVFDYQSFNTATRAVIETTHFDEHLRRFGEVAWNKAYRRSFVEYYQLNFPAGLNFEDTAIVPVIMALAKHRQKVDYCGYHYRRQRPGAITGEVSADSIAMRQAALDYLMDQAQHYQTDMTVKARRQLTHTISGRWFLLWRDYQKLPAQEALTERFIQAFSSRSIRRGFFNQWEPKYWLAGLWAWFWLKRAKVHTR
ncbi:glycosyltransferase family 2 protein [Lactobacillaceae bacterium L1_55_11]|nr:glycosyltransferase family 2 protein [Lactobacillaceae bacterium L1_55_11]